MPPWLDTQDSGKVGGEIPIPMCRNSRVESTSTRASASASARMGGSSATLTVADWRRTLLNPGRDYSPLTVRSVSTYSQVIKPLNVFIVTCRVALCSSASKLDHRWSQICSRNFGCNNSGFSNGKLLLSDSGLFRVTYARSIRLIKKLCTTSGMEENERETS